MLRVVGPEHGELIRWPVKSGGLYKDTLVITDSGATAATAAIATQIILGVVNQAYDAAEIASIEPVRGKRIEIDIYQSATKKTFADTDIGTAYDLVVASNAMYLNGDDTTNGYLVLESYDNARGKAIVRVLDTCIYLS